MKHNNQTKIFIDYFYHRCSQRLAVALLGGVMILLGGCSLTPPTPVVSERADPTTVYQPTRLPTVAGRVEVGESPATFPSPIVTPAAPATPATPTPVVTPMPIPTPKHGPFVYHTVTAGQSLGYISYLYGIDIEKLVAMNDLAGPSAIIQIDQKLRVPVQTDDIAPTQRLLSDSEVLYSPAYVDFDIVEFATAQGGYLASYEEYVDSAPLTGPEIVERVAEQFSVGPRLLLALLEHYGEWVTNPTPTDYQIQAPLGPHNPRAGSLYRSLAFTANRINAGYYGYKRDGFWIFSLPDGSRAISARGVNAGTIGVQNILAIYSDWDTWQQELAGEGMLAVYRELFGDPAEYDIGPIVPIDLVQPPLDLPWANGQGFYFTSGPHGGYVDGSGWAAIDFGPPDVLGNCFYSNEPNTAAADGVILTARQGEVYLDLDGDGNIQTGWVLLYLHVALDIETPVQAGQQVQQGDVIGYASCEAGLSTSSHLHFARRYNGEWIAAGGPVPMNLDGWVVQPNMVPYEGKIARGDKIREACECWEPDLNLIVNEGEAKALN